MHDIKVMYVSIRVVLNSRDWSEIVWFPETLYLKTPTGMHRLGYNDAVSWLNKVKTQIFTAYSQF